MKSCCIHELDSRKKFIEQLDIQYAGMLASVWACSQRKKLL